MSAERICQAVSTPVRTQTIRAGAVHAEPAWLDLEGSVERTVRLIANVAAQKLTGRVA
jgi:hypothetical protein